MVLVGNWRPEERHDAAHADLKDGAVVALDRPDHPLEDRVEELERFFGIVIREEVRGALEFGKEDGDLLALALKPIAEGRDALGAGP
jgi:hypothetical protein